MLRPSRARGHAVATPLAGGHLHRHQATFNEDGDAERVVEAYAITDDWLDLYGHQARVEFAGFLRPQIKFDSADDLVVELKRNVEETKRLTA